MRARDYFMVVVLSCALVISGPAEIIAKSKGKTHAKTSSRASGKGSSKTPSEPSPLAQGVDSIFAVMKKDLDEIAASPLVTGKSVAPVNSYFLKVLKENQPFYSLTRVNKAGDVVNEVVRLAENTDVKKQNLAKEAWFVRAGKKHKEYAGMIKLEENGRYYLLWAIPVLNKNGKSKESFEGALLLKTDLWDSFHKYAKTIETPFLITMGRFPLYSNKWKDSIDYKERALSVPGIQRIAVRYPKSATVIVAAPPSLPEVSASAALAADSMRMKATQDSIKKAEKLKQEKKKSKTRNIVIIALIALIVIVAVLIVVVLPAIRQKSIMANIDKEES